MKLTNTKTTKSNKGMTLIELTVVILVLLSLISVLFIGARAWMRGSDRANAALLIRNAQQGVRSHSNIMGVDTPAPPVQGGVALPWPTTLPDLSDSVFGPGAYVETLAPSALPAHPDSALQAAGGFVAGPAGDFDSVPALTDLYMESNGTLEQKAFYRPNGVQ